MRQLLAVLILIAAVQFSFPVFSAELLMLEQPGCPWCARFNEEIAPTWPRTKEGQRAPLRRVDITEPWPDDLSNIRREILTPTFVLIDDGEEIARLRGYPGDEFFWFRIGEMLDQLPPPGQPTETD
ncbi:transcriptional regulator [Notoacmeibacter sp. MSK16QG-6]|uniref:transcriptional regulator n=1 Tax=Notoacmeibacter sp. MSK16QG-6 TaxID=2957982 RepID=UPI0020A22704|nr:transcriptional regulator [Notoacmeibacter sp. MSK16QG-6]MCP1200822.1 transcriptional regulator [Notoacmeibacter sp. MSK16QG-6]